MKKYLGWSLVAIVLVCVACVSQPIQEHSGDDSELRRLEESLHAQQVASAKLQGEVGKLVESLRLSQQSEAAASARMESQYKQLVDEIRRLPRPAADNDLSAAIERQGETVAGALDGVGGHIPAISAALESLATAAGKTHQVQLLWPDKALELNPIKSDNVPGSIMALITACIAAAVSFFVARMSGDRNEQTQRKLLASEGKLNRITSQLNDLYAPFYFMTKSSSDLFNDFCRDVNRDPAHFFEKDAKGNICDPPADVLVQWRHVMKHVFLPINRAREKIALAHAALVDDEKFAEQLVEMISHIADFRRLMKAWPAANDVNEAAAAWKNGGRANFAPEREFRGKELLASAEHGFNRLNKMKSDLEKELGSDAPTRSWLNPIQRQA